MFKKIIDEKLIKTIKKSLLVMVVVSFFGVTGCSSDSVKKTENNNNEVSENKTVPKETLDVSKKTIEADVPILDYASDNNIVMHDNQYVYVYSMKDAKMISWMDLEEIGYVFTQGDTATMVDVFSDEEHIHIYQANAKEDGFIFEMTTGNYTSYDTQKLKYGDVLTKQYVESDTYTDSISEIYKCDAGVFYLKLKSKENTFYENICLIREKDAEKEIYYLFVRR